MSGLQQQIDDRRDFGRQVCQCIAENIVKLGFTLRSPIVPPSFDGAEFALVVDPYSQSQDLVGYWYGPGRMRIGQIKFHGDGSFYAEYDVAQPHPKKPGMFVEAINAWGRDRQIKTEAKLLELPND